MNILVFGDVVGRGGREAVKTFLEKFKKENEVDFIAINGENLAHGKGITTDTAEEMFNMGVDVITNGNHTWDVKQAFELLQNNPKVLRPANFAPQLPGKGSILVEKGIYSVAVLNLHGRVFFKENHDDPFRAAEEWLTSLPRVKPLITLVDFHAEATSEKKAMGFFLDGRVTAVLGTHTHVPTADEQILPQGTAYISDIGMSGSLNSILGVQPPAVLERFKTQLSIPLEVAEEKPWEVNAIFLTINQEGKAEKIQRIREIIN